VSRYEEHLWKFSLQKNKYEKTYQVAKSMTYIYMSFRTRRIWTNDIFKYHFGFHSIALSWIRMCL